MDPSMTTPQPELILAMWIPVSIAVALLGLGALCWLMLRPDEDAAEELPPSPYPPGTSPGAGAVQGGDSDAIPEPTEWPSAEKFSERLQVSWPEPTESAPAANPELQAKKELPDLYKEGVEIVESMPFYIRDPGAYFDKYGMRPAERKFAWEKRIGVVLDVDSLQKHRVSFQARIPPDPRAADRFVSPDEQLQRDIEVRLGRLASTLGEVYGIKVRPPNATA